MERRSFIEVTFASTMVLTGCSTDGTGSDMENACTDAEVVDVTVKPGKGKTSTPGTDTPTPAPVTEDFIIVTVRNDADTPVTVMGNVITIDGRKEFSRSVPANVGVHELRFGPFAHNGIKEYEFWIKGCQTESSQL